MRAAVAAGHPATVEVGVEVLAEGGSAADAAVAAGLASCVAETVMTGLLGGGHAIHYDAGIEHGAESRLLRRGAGLGAEPGRRAELVELEVPFGTSSSTTRSGSPRSACPGCRRDSARCTPSTGGCRGRTGRARAAARARRGRLPARARRLPGDARAGDDDERGRVDLRAGRRAPKAGGRLQQPGLVRALELLADEGPRSAYDGSLATALLDLMDGLGGVVTRDDLTAYEAAWSEPAEVPYSGVRLLTREGLAPLGDSLAALPSFAARRQGRGRSRWRARSTGPTRRATRPTWSRSTRRATPASSPPASASARATGCPGSTST